MRGPRLTKLLSENIAWNIVGRDLDGIMRMGRHPREADGPLKIESKIHKMVLVGSSEGSAYGYKDLVSHLGPFLDFTESGPSKRKGYYERDYIRRKSDFILHIYVNPRKEFMPRFKLEIYPTSTVDISHYKDFLSNINRKIPGLKISCAEYAIDLYCKTGIHAANVFSLLRRFLYVPYQRNSRTYEDDEKEINDIGRDKITVSRTIHIGNVKIYERGDDSDKNRQSGGWERDKINRVRLEFSAKRRILKSTGIYALNDFLHDAQFHRINNPLYQFAYFKNSSKLPNVWEPYNCKDSNGVAGCFVTECAHYRKIVRNIAQYIRNADSFVELRKNIEASWKAFDDEWKRI